MVKQFLGRSIPSKRAWCPNAAAPDAQLLAAINANPVKITPACCQALVPFNAPTPPCGCDSTILPAAQASGFDANGLLTLQSKPFRHCSRLLGCCRVVPGGTVCVALPPPPGSRPPILSFPLSPVLLRWGFRWLYVSPSPLLFLKSCWSCSGVGSLACGQLAPPIAVGKPAIVTCPAPAAGRKLFL